MLCSLSLAKHIINIVTVWYLYKIHRRRMCRTNHNEYLCLRVVCERLRARVYYVLHLTFVLRLMILSTTHFPHRLDA